VHVDEAGRDVEPGGVDLARRARAGQIAHRDDLAPGNAHIRHERRVSGAVQHTPPSNQQVEGLGLGGEGHGDGEQDPRWKDYSEAMGQLSRDHPEDLEAASLYAVSMFGVTGGERDYRTYMKIASIGQEVFRRNPDHPGALHYLIHAFDDPVHAPLGLPYAHRYSKVASAAPHAQHMPSHIFLALGMWDECISSNIDSWNSSEERVARLGLGSRRLPDGQRVRRRRGLVPGRMDEAAGLGLRHGAPVCSARDRAGAAGCCARGVARARPCRR